jgi:hypothetical protein
MKHNDYMKMFLLIGLFVIFGFDSFSQTSDSIIVHKDPRLDIINQKQALINKRSKLMTASGLYKGFRLQVLSTNNRNLATQIKYTLLQAYPHEKVYVAFQSPYFKVKFGNFIKRADAEKMRKELQRLSPQGIFVVEDTIEYAPKDDEDLK